MNRRRFNKFGKVKKNNFFKTIEKKIENISDDEERNSKRRNPNNKRRNCRK